MNAKTEMLLSILIDTEDTENILAEVVKEYTILEVIFLHEAYTKPSTAYESFRTQAMKTKLFFDPAMMSESNVGELIYMKQEERILGYINDKYPDTMPTSQYIKCIADCQNSLENLCHHLAEEQIRLNRVRALLGFTVK